MADHPETDRGDEMQERVDTLDEHIEDAERKLEARRDDAGAGGEVTGEFEDEQATAGADPEGAHEEQG